MGSRATAQVGHLHVFDHIADGLGGDLLHVGRGEFLDVHQERSVTVDVEPFVEQAVTVVVQAVAELSGVRVDGVRVVVAVRKLQHAIGESFQIVPAHDRSEEQSQQVVGPVIDQH